VLFLEDVSAAGPDRPAIRLNTVQDRYRRIVSSKLADDVYRLESVDECLCGGGSATPIARQDRFGIPVGFVACERCSLVRTTPRLASTHLPAFYRDDYHGLHQGVPSPEPSMALYRTGQGDVIFAYVADLLPTGRVRVAEIGAGTGQVLREFVRAAEVTGRTIEAIGCELAPAYVEAGRSVGTDIRHGSTEVLESSGACDLVILSHVLEHFANIPRELELIRRLVGPLGYLFVEVPGLLSIHHKSQYNFRLAEYLTLAHTYHFSLDTLTDVLGRAGFGLLRGDEEIRAVFRPLDAPLDRATARGTDRLLEYLAWLESSGRLRTRRTALRARRALRRAGAGVARRLLTERAYAALRHTLRRLRIAK
jgi:SAM-dependent methyltransferase